MSSSRSAGTVQGIVLILPITLTVMGAVLLAPIMPKLMVAFGHISGAKYLVPMLISLPALCIAVGAPFAGWLADRLGRRRLLIGSITIYAAFGIAPLFLNSYWPIFVSRVGVGICEAILITCSTTLIGDYFSGAQRDKWLGSQAALASLSSLLLFPIAGFLGATFGWKGPFAIYSVALLMVVGVILFTWEIATDTQAERGAEPASARADSGTEFPWLYMLRVCSFTLIGGMLFYVLPFQLSSALQLFAVDDPAKAGVMLSIASIGVPAGAICYRYVNTRLSLRNLITLEFIVIAIGFLGMSQATVPEMLVTFGFINQFGAGMMLPTMLTWAVSGLNFMVRGRGTGMWQSTFAVGQFISTLAFSLVLTFVGADNFLNAFVIFAMVSGVTAIGAYFTVKTSS